MNIKIAIIGIIVVLLLVGASFAGIIPLGLFGDGEYHTGISMSQVNNCETERLKTGVTELLWQEVGAHYGNIEVGYSELIQTPFDNGPVVTAMSSGEGKRSVSITVQGTLTFVGIANTVSYWSAKHGWYIVEMSTDGILWTPIIDTQTNNIDQSIVGDVSGATSEQNYYNYNPMPIPGFPTPILAKAILPFSFNIKDTQVGAIRVKQMTEYYALGGLKKKVVATSIDYAFLISGEGNVDIVDPQTRYIAGEDTIRFSVDTGYSGTTQGGTYTGLGWELKVKDNNGDTVKTWYLGDDKTNARRDKNGNLLDYAIPSNAVIAGQSHMWSVVLTNTLFKQDDETFFAITKDELLMAPDIKPITFSAEEYELGDTVVITLEGVPNPLGRDTIDGFIVNVLYGKDGVDYVLDYHNKYISSTGSTTATISFTVAKGDKYVTVEAWAFDYPESQGGIMSEKVMGQVWVKENSEGPPEAGINWLGIAICAIIAVIGFIVAIFMPNPYLKMLVAIIGIIAAVIVYLMFFMGTTF